MWLLIAAIYSAMRRLLWPLPFIMFTRIPPFGDEYRGEWGTFSHFLQNWLWHTHFQQLVFHTFLVYSLQQERNPPFVFRSQLNWFRRQSRLCVVASFDRTCPIYGAGSVTCRGTFCQCWDIYSYHRTPSGVHGLFHFSVCHSSSSITIY